jgi:LytS/YehU family sensor histidine kinase
LVLSVTNRGSGGACEPAVSANQVRKGIGLANIRQRLSINYGEQASLETVPLGDGYRAVIRLPARFDRLNLQEA